MQYITEESYSRAPAKEAPHITTYANIPRVDRFYQFFVRLVSFILDRKRLIALSVRQSSSPSPQPGISKLTTPTIHTY